jgi:Phage integrase family
VWKPTLKAANLEIHVRLRDLRHAHASWLLAGGADLQVVRQRLGHGTLRTTERYLHTLPDADETALEALAKIRYRGCLHPVPASLDISFIGREALSLFRDPSRQREARMGVEE